MVNVNEAPELAPFVIAGGSDVTMRPLTGSRIGLLNYGPIINSGKLTLERCNFNDNQAGFGGVVASDGTLIVFESTLSNNYAILGGEAIESEGTLIVSGSTFAGNRSVIGGRSAVEAI